MKITKLGHCCLLVEEGGLKFMTDPGNYTVEAQEKITGLDAIVITHEHQDHFHADSVKALLVKNPAAIVITNAAVGKLLKALGVAYVQVGDGESTQVKGVRIEGFGKDHAPIYQTMGLVENTGYMLAGKLYFPGDSFHVPMTAAGGSGPTGKAVTATATAPVTVDILALPVAGPWMKISEAIDFAKKVKARNAFGVHDGMIQPAFRGFVGMILKMFVPETEYVALGDGENREF